MIYFSSRSSLMKGSLHDLLNKHLNDANTFISYVKDAYSLTYHKVEFNKLFNDLLTFDGDYNKWIITYGINHLINRDDQFDEMINERIQYYSRFHYLLYPHESGALSSDGTKDDVAITYEKLKSDLNEFVKLQSTKIPSYLLYYIVVPTIMIKLVFLNRYNCTNNND